MLKARKVFLERETKETQIVVDWNLDGSGLSKIQTGIGFFDHMLELFAFHGSFDLNVKCKGDLKVDAHHSIEDVGIVMGRCLLQALEDQKGIRRYASVYLPMDETLSRTCLDLGGRAYYVFIGTFQDSLVGSFPLQMTEHFFYSLATNAKVTLHQEILYGKNDHHKVEALFKGLARSLRKAIERIDHKIPSSKGVL